MNQTTTAQNTTVIYTLVCITVDCRVVIVVVALDWCRQRRQRTSSRNILNLITALNKNRNM